MLLLVKTQRGISIVNWREVRGISLVGMQIKSVNRTICYRWREEAVCWQRRGMKENMKWKSYCGRSGSNELSHELQYYDDDVGDGKTFRIPQWAMLSCSLCSDRAPAILSGAHTRLVMPNVCFYLEVFFFRSPLQAFRDRKKWQKILRQWMLVTIDFSFKSCQICPMVVNDVQW